ncbi:MAG: penicillin-binding protein activator, partial [Methylococcales bacterium]
MQFESPRKDLLSGWMELTKVFKQSLPGTRVFDQRIEEWKQKFPDHSANIPVLLAKVSLERGPFTMPEAIAVLLPLSGPYAPSGEAVRQGILIARKYDQANQVTTRFYDSEHADIAKLYRRVVAEGADIVIGPLEKPLLKSLATRVRLSVPVLGLNQVPELNVPMLYQFGLNPEDEVDQAANSAWFDGYHRALILAPANRHGRRLADDFSKKWQQLGGEIARSESYNPKNNRYNEVIRRLLDTDTSDSIAPIVVDRAGATAAVRDSQFIFLVAQPAQARLIKPLIDHYNHGRMAVYATAQVFSGHASPDEDRDLGGIAFCDIPWLFNMNIEHAPTLE